MKFAIALILTFGLGIAIGAVLVLDGVRRQRQAAMAVRAECAALEPRIAKLEAAALEAGSRCVKVEKWQLDIYDACPLGTRPKVAKQ